MWGCKKSKLEEKRPAPAGSDSRNSGNTKVTTVLTNYN